MRDLPKYPAVGSRLRGNDGWGVRGLGCGELGWSVGRGFPPAREGRRGRLWPWPPSSNTMTGRGNASSLARVSGQGRMGGCLDVGYVAA